MAKSNIKYISRVLNSHLNQDIVNIIGSYRGEEKNNFHKFDDNIMELSSTTDVSNYKEEWTLLLSLKKEGMYGIYSKKEEDYIDENDENMYDFVINKFQCYKCNKQSWECECEIMTNKCICNRDLVMGERFFFINIITKKIIVVGKACKNTHLEEKTDLKTTIKKRLLKGEGGVGKGGYWTKIKDLDEYVTDIILEVSGALTDLELLDIIEKEQDKKVKKIIKGIVSKREKKRIKREKKMEKERIKREKERIIREKKREEERIIREKKREEERIIREKKQKKQFLNNFIQERNEKKQQIPILKKIRTSQRECGIICRKTHERKINKYGKMNKRCGECSKKFYKGLKQHFGVKKCSDCGCNLRPIEKENIFKYYDIKKKKITTIKTFDIYFKWTRCGNCAFSENLQGDPLTNFIFSC